MNPKIQQALDIMTGCTEVEFAELAVLAADQAGMSGDAQTELRNKLLEPFECSDCGEVHGERCPWRDTCGECLRNDMEMHAERLCVDCHDDQVKLALRQAAEDAREGYGDYLRDQQKDNW